MSLAEAAALVTDGMRIGLGGFAIYQRPMAFVRELIRQRREGLTVVGVTNSIEVDMLIGAGVCSRVETSYMGFEKFGLAPNFRRASEKHGFDCVDYPELLAWDRFRADQDGLDFWPASGLGGTDLVAQNPEIKAFDCPVSGKPLHALPAAKLDVAVIHAIAADEFGNVIVPSFRTLPQSFDITLSRCCRQVIVTVERVVSENFERRHANLIQIPAARVQAVVELPFGAHPTSMLGRYVDDAAHWNEYIGAAKSEEEMAAYLKANVFDAPTHDAYLDRIGGARLAGLLQVDTQQ
jgi:glutaconate CoA-transferase subunit A